MDCPTGNAILCTQILNIQASQSHGKYLGYPIFHSKPKNTDFKFFLENMKHKLVGWKTRFLTMAGRIVLSKSSLSCIPTHIMQYIKIISKVHKHINKIQRDFVWGSCAEKIKLHMLSWDNLTSPTDRGGLGLHKSDIRNRAFLASLAWRLSLNPTSLWSLILTTKYNNSSTNLPSRT